MKPLSVFGVSLAVRSLKEAREARSPQLLNVIYIDTPYFLEISLPRSSTQGRSQTRSFFESFKSIEHESNTHLLSDGHVRANNRTKLSISVGLRRNP
jgi:hypothetical protein